MPVNRTRLLVLVVPAISVAVFVAPAGAVTRRHTAAGNALAGGTLLRRSDFGPGWSASSPPRSVPPLTCRRFHPATGGVVEDGAAGSPTFSAGSSGPFVSQDAYAYATGAQAGEFWRRSTKAGLLRCLSDSLKSGSAGGVRFTVTGSRPLALAGLPTPARFYRVSGTATMPDQAVDVFLDMIVMSRGRTVTEISVSSLEQAPARQLELRLARTVAGRL